MQSYLGFRRMLYEIAGLITNTILKVYKVTETRYIFLKFKVRKLYFYLLASKVATFPDIKKNISI